MNWTDERVELLTKLWAEGLSASQIAAQLGGVSRNAVIGKVHRLKLSGRGKTTKAQPRAPKTATPNTAQTNTTTTAEAAPTSSAASAPRAARPSTERAAPRAEATPSEPRARKVETPTPSRTAPQTEREPRTNPTFSASSMKVDFAARAAANYDAAALASSASDNNVVPMKRNLTLLQLTESTCKWPIGDPLNEDFHFCGADAGEASPYCSYHSKIAFQPISDRRRVRA